MTYCNQIVHNDQLDGWKIFTDSITIPALAKFFVTNADERFLCGS